MGTHLRAMGRHLQYGITLSLVSQVNAPHLNPGQPGRYSIYLTRGDGRLDRESNPQPLNRKSDALTLTPPSHPGGHHCLNSISFPSITIVVSYLFINVWCSEHLGLYLHHNNIDRTGTCYCLCKNITIINNYVHIWLHNGVNFGVKHKKWSYSRWTPENVNRRRCSINVSCGYS